MPPGQYKRGATHEERFWSKVDKSGECWIFNAPSIVGGYGRWRVKKKMELVHRSAYALLVGPLTDEDNVFQTCRTKLCVRPEHLYKGSKNSGPREERPTEPPDKGRYASTKWRDIPEFLGYEASVEGHIRSWWVHGRGIYAKKPKILTPTPNVQHGYLQVMLTNAQGRKNKPVHQCVLEAFVGPRPPGMECRHYPDRDLANNKLSNLSYTDHQTNMDDRHIHGTVPKGENHWMRKNPEKIVRGEDHWMHKKPELIPRGSARHNSKLTAEDCDSVLALLAKGHTQEEIAKRFGVSQERISAIKMGKRGR